MYSGKTVDEFSHGGAGWQGLVTENCSSAKTQPCLDRDLPPRGSPLSGRSVHASAGRAAFTLAGKKGTAMLFPSPPPSGYQCQVPRGTQVFEFFRKCFWFGFSGDWHALMAVCPIRTPSLAVSLYFLFTVFLCVRACWAAHFGCIIY